MSTTELKTSTKRLIDSLDITDSRSMEILISVFSILNVFSKSVMQGNNFEEEKTEIKFKRSPLSDRVRNMSVKMNLPADFNEKEFYHFCALSANADIIITRNTKDFKNSTIQVKKPSEIFE